MQIGAGDEKGVMQLPQAKVVGGGSSINGGTALRSTELDSKEWVALGNEAWDFESCRRVYESLEDDEVRGTRGPHPIRRATEDEMGRIQKAFVAGAKEVGMRWCADLNETGAEGVGASPVTRRGWQRISAANTFVDPIRGWRNFTIRSEAMVDRILFEETEGKPPRATGVLLVGGETVRCSGEVLVSAGAIFSPAILQRSGIGPAALLQKYDIPQIVDLPVGHNGSDHPCVPLVAKPRPGAYEEGDYSLQTQARFSSSLQPGAIDHQIVCFSYLFAQAPDPRVQARTLSGSATGHVAGIGCNLNKPTALGVTEIVSRDPLVQPRVAPNYLGTEHDRKSFREIVRTAYKVFMSEPFQRCVEAPIDLTDEVVADDGLLDKYVDGHCTTTYHFCSTCRMASREKGGVVDQSGRVYGVEGLRVADASVLPTVPASNTMWATMMFADRIGRSVRDGVDVKTSSGARL